MATVGKQRMTAWPLSVALFLLPLASYAEQRLDLEGASIIGSKELPKVLHIVPWKKVGMSKLSVPPQMNLATQAIKPVDRNVFLREINYHQTLLQHAEGSR